MARRRKDRKLASSLTRPPGWPGTRRHGARLALLVLAVAILLLGSAAAGIALSCYLTFGHR